MVEQNILSQNQIIEMAVNAGKFILSGAIGALIVTLINHFKQKHDKRVQLESDLYSLFCKFFFVASIQYSELVNKKKEIEARLAKEKELEESSSKEEIVGIVQDFDYDPNINIDVKDLSDALFKIRSMKSFQSGDAQMLQPLYLLNDKYHEIVRHFSSFNEMKRSIKDEPYFIALLMDYVKGYMPVVIQKIDKELLFIKSTLDSCDELFKKLGKSRPLKFGAIVKL